MAGKPIATVGSMHVCPMCSGTVPHVGGPIVGPGAPNVLVNNKPVALMGDMCVCVGPPDVIAQGNPLVKVNGVPVVCLGDLTAHGGAIVAGEPTVTISSAVPTPPVTMPREKIPFPTITLINKIRASVVGHSLKEAEENIATLKELAPETIVEEDSIEVTLETTFPIEQLQLLAQSTNFDDFLIHLIDTFGMDIPTKAYEELYHDALEQAAVLTPTLLVKKQIPNGGKAVFYNNQQVQEIWVGEQIIRDAAEDNDTCGELLVVLIEEYGHWLDYLLRNHYAETERKDALRDEGAYFSYKLLQLNSIDNADQYYADATIEGASTQLTWDYEPFHKAIKEFVNEERWHKDDHFGPFELYKAGFLEEKEGQYSHGNIEQLGLTNSYFASGLDELFKEDKENQINNYLLNIYFGNWKRDYSQGLDPLILRVVSNTLAMLVDEGNELMEDKSIAGVYERFNIDRITSKTLAENDEISLDLNKFGIPFVEFDPITFKPVDKAVKVISTILEMLAVKEFVHNPIKEAEEACDFKFLPEQIAKAEKNNNGSYTFPAHLKKETGNKSVLNYKEYLNLLKYNFSAVDKENMGVYIPAEHIDNPTGIGENSAVNDRDMLNEFMGNDLGVDDTDDIHSINMDFGMKNYIRNSKPKKTPSLIGGQKEATRFKNSHAYILYKLKNACKSGGHSIPKCKDDLGAALHTLEDFFAHSNYAELALIKEGAYAVFPWVTCVEGKIDYLRYITDPEEKYRVENSDACNILNKEHFVDINDTNRLVTKLPLVTGTFGPLDTVASILPIIAHVFDADAHKIKVEKTKKEEKEYKEETGHFYYEDKINMTSFIDVLVLELLRDLTNPDNADKEGVVEDSKLVKTFLSLLHARDMAFEALNETSQKGHDVYDSLPEFAQKFIDSIVDTTGAAKDWASEGIGELIEKVKMPIYRFFYTFLQFAAININDVQSLMGIEIDSLGDKKDELNLSIGLNPTHTQVAKDDPHHPMHTLSAKLAIEAVERVGTEVFKVWQGGGSFEEVTKAVNSIMLHPAASNWQTSTVREWMQGTSKHKRDNGDIVTVTNKELICEASTPTTALDRLAHTNEEIEETLEQLRNISNSPQFKRFNKVSDKVVEELKEYDSESFGKVKDAYKKAKTTTNKKVKEVKEGNKEVIGYFEKQLRGIEATMEEQKAELARKKKVWNDTFPLPLYCTMDGAPILYQVKNRDTLSELAIKGNTNVKDLLQLNPSIDPATHKIFTGQYIKVPNSIMEGNRNISINPEFKL